MLKIVSRVLLLCAACLGTIPADKCLLMLAGDCCSESHVIQLTCAAHDHHSDADHDGDSQTAPDSDHHHHATCVVLSSDSLTLQTQDAPVIDLHQDHVPLHFDWVAIDTCNTAASAHDSADSRGGVKPPDPELFLLTHSFLI